MATFAEQLARLRVAAATGRASRDLLAWTVLVLEELGPGVERLAERNRLLRQAAALVSGSQWAKAKRLEKELRALHAHPALRERAADDGVRDLVAEALRAAPAPRSSRQLFRVLCD